MFIADGEQRQVRERVAKKYVVTSDHDWEDESRRAAADLRGVDFGSLSDHSKRPRCACVVARRQERVSASAQTAQTLDDSGNSKQLICDSAHIACRLGRLSCHAWRLGGNGPNKKTRTQKHVDNKS